MLFRLRALFQRYADRHGPDFRTRSLPQGRIERAEAVAGGIRITGWSEGTFRFVWATGSVDVSPDLPRPDVARIRSLPLACGFEAMVPDDVAGLMAEGAGWARAIPVPQDAPGLLARLRLALSFAVALSRAAPPLLHHLVRQDPASRADAKRRLGLDGVPPAPLLSGHWFVSAEALAVEEVPVTLVLPVHDAMHVLPLALARIAAHTDLPWHLIVVDDASNDPAIALHLEGWARTRPGQVTIVRHPENRGFVAAANTGFALAEGRRGPVILLNSDTMVPSGWASRLVAPLLADARVATATPLSNDAEILSVPRICVATPLPPGLGDRLDCIARGFVEDWPEIPTGVGFCMAMSRQWLANVPRFDPAFGRGYGEEVDWCRRVSALGGRHVAVPRLFVEHVGGQSFGAAKAARVASANVMLARRYPGFNAEVRRVIASDPLATPRMALAVALEGQDGPLPIYLAHSMGGGAEFALQRELAGHRAAVVLRVGGRRHWRVEMHGSGGIAAAETDDLGIVHALLAPVAARDIIYSCGVGAATPMRLPEQVLSLRRAGYGDRITLRLHDYFPLSPSYCLLADDGRYRGPAMAAPLGHDPEEWRGAWAVLIDAVEEVTVFSEASGALFCEVFPLAADKLRLRPHAVPPAANPRSMRQDGAQAIGILGNLNAQKGAHLVADIARRSRLPIIVIGQVDPAIPLPRSVRVHGSYLPEEVPGLVARYGITRWIMPAIWPETFSFATREMLATGLPVMGFALGAQGEALARAPNGEALPYDPDADLAGDLLRALHACPDPLRRSATGPKVRVSRA